MSGLTSGCSNAASTAIRGRIVPRRKNWHKSSAPSAAPPRLDLSDGAWEAFDWRKVGLWAVLLAATAALALAVVRLLKLSQPQGGGS